MSTNKRFVPEKPAPDRALLTDEERAKIVRAVKAFDDTGLFGQFSEQAGALDDWTKQIETMMEATKAVMGKIVKEKRFAKFFEKPDSLPMGWSTNQILLEAESHPQGWSIWSMNLGDNRNLRLVYTTNGDLILVNDMYQYQGEHTKDFHWFLRHDARPGGIKGLGFDSFRLFLALTILSKLKKARVYFRAKINVRETHR